MNQPLNDRSAAGQAVVILTVSPWDEPKRLRKQLAEVLSVDMNVVYVTLPYGLRKPARDEDRMDGRVRVLSLAGPRVPFRLLARVPGLRAAYDRLLAWRMRRRLRGAGNIRAVFCFTPEHPEVLASFHRVPVIYVANDDYASMGGSDAGARAIARAEARTVALSDRVISVSEVIARKLSSQGKPVHVMYPGHDSEILPLERFAGERRIARSACFFGYIDWRIDFELLEFLLGRGWHIALIGSVVGTDRQIAALQALFRERFEVRSAMSAAQAPEALSRYEVLIVPYRYRSAAQAEVMELPNKIFIYFSALRPVVTTWMPNLKMVEPGLIYRASTPEEFEAQCLRAIEVDSPAYGAARRRIAQENTWDARRSALRAIMEGTAPDLAGVAP